MIVLYTFYHKCGATNKWLFITPRFILVETCVETITSESFDPHLKSKQYIKTDILLYPAGDIHHNGEYFDTISTEELEKIEDFKVKTMLQSMLK